jgi:hypothetical protein
MRARGDGALLMRLGESASRPYPQIGNIGIAMAAVRHYQFNLSAALADTGVYAGLIQVGGGIAGSAAIREFTGDVDPGQLLDPADLAQLCWDMYLKRDRFEEVVRPSSTWLAELTAEWPGSPPDVAGNQAIRTPKVSAAR